MNALTVIGTILSALGALTVVAGVALAVQSGLRSQSWKPVKAKVVRSEVQSRVDSDNDRVFFGVYTVRYEVEGQMVESTLRSNPQSTSEAEIRSRAAHHPPGTERAIFYNPAKPAQIAAEVGVRAFAVPFGFAAMGLLFLIVGGLIWYGSQPAEW